MSSGVQKFKCLSQNFYYAKMLCNFQECFLVGYYKFTYFTEFYCVFYLVSFLLGWANC